MLHHLRKVLLAEHLRRLHEVSTAVRLGEVPDAQAVGWVQLAVQELAAGLLHTCGDKDGDTQGAHLLDIGRHPKSDEKSPFYLLFNLHCVYLGLQARAHVFE